MSYSLQIALLVLQTFAVTFLLFHDFIPLGPFNNLAAIRSQDSLQHSIIVSLIGAIPAAIGLYWSARSLGQSYPHALRIYMLITYFVFFYGLLRAWWIPYFFRTDPERAKRYQIIFANTHTFLPKRNGMAPDTLHTVFHLAVVFVLITVLIAS